MISIHIKTKIRSLFSQIIAKIMDPCLKINKSSLRNDFVTRTFMVLEIIFPINMLATWDVRHEVCICRQRGINRKRSAFWVVAVQSSRLI